MADYLIKANSLSVGYDKKIIVNGVDIAINKGQILTLIGPNGSGKTTILKAIAGQLPPIAGSVFIDGMDISKTAATDLAKKMAQLFTERNIKESISCFDVVALGRYPYTGFLGKLSKEDETIILDSMEKTRVLELRDNDFTRISDGQRQRVLLARALTQKPEIMILDEPTTFLDIRYRLEFLSLLLELSQKENFAVIMTEHDLDMAYQISDQIMCIKDSRVDKIGSPDEIFSEGYINKLFDISVGSFNEKLNRGFLNGR